MKKIICLLFICLMILPLINAETNLSEDLYPRIKSAIKPYLGRKVSVPLSSLYCNEIVDVYLADSTPVGYGMVVDCAFVDADRGTHENATINAYIEDEDVIFSLIESEDKIDKFYELKDEGKIRVEPVGPGRKIRWFLISIMARMLNWLT